MTPADWPRELQPLAIAFDEMLKRLDDSFTRLSQFSADLAHELRTPIANMIGEAQVALTRDRTAAEYRDTIESTVGECERLSRIVDNLLFVARWMQRANNARKRFDARAAVQKIAAFIKRLRTIVTSQSVAAATGRFMPTPTCSSARSEICSTMHCASRRRMVQFKFCFRNAMLISKSRSGITAVEWLPNTCHGCLIGFTVPIHRAAPMEQAWSGSGKINCRPSRRVGKN